MMNQSKKAFGT